MPGRPGGGVHALLRQSRRGRIVAFDDVTAPPDAGTTINLIVRIAAPRRRRSCTCSRKESRPVNRVLLSTVAIGALLSVQPALAIEQNGPQPVVSATVPVMATINYGPWSLHQGPATAAVPYVGYCAHGRQTVSPGTEPMQPYYFPHIATVGGYLQGWFDYRPRNAQEAVVAAFSLDHGLSWQFQNKAAALDFIKLLPACWHLASQHFTLFLLCVGYLQLSCCAGMIQIKGHAEG